MLSRLATALLFVAVAFVGSAKAAPHYIIGWTVCCEPRINDDGTMGPSVYTVKLLQCRLNQCPNDVIHNDPSSDVTIDDPVIYMPVKSNTKNNLQGNSTADDNYKFDDAWMQNTVDGWNKVEISFGADQSADDINANTGMIVKKIKKSSGGWNDNVNTSSIKVSLVRVLPEEVSRFEEVVMENAQAGKLGDQLDMKCVWVKARDIDCSTEDSASGVSGANLYDGNGNRYPLGLTFNDLLCMDDVWPCVEQLMNVHHDDLKCCKLDHICDFKTDKDRVNAIARMVDNLRKTEVQDLEFNSTMPTGSQGNVDMIFKGQVYLMNDLIICCKKWHMSFPNPGTPEAPGDLAVFNAIIDAVEEKAEDARCSLIDTLELLATPSAPGVDPLLQIICLGTTDGEAPVGDGPNSFGTDYQVSFGGKVANFQMECVE